MLSSQVGHEAGQKPLTRIQKRESDGVPSPGDPSQAYTTTTEEGKSLQPFKATSIRWIPETVSRAASPRESSRDSRVRGDQSRHRTGAWVEVSVQNAKERPLEICNCSKMGGGELYLGRNIIHEKVRKNQHELREVNNPAILHLSADNDPHTTV